MALVNGVLDKSARGPHRRDVTHILRKISGFLKILSFSLVTETIAFFLPIQIVIFPLCFECYATMPMLTFRAWATCGSTEISAVKTSSKQ